MAFALSCFSQGLKQSAWSTTTNPAVARAALGVDDNTNALNSAQQATLSSAITNGDPRSVTAPGLSIAASQLTSGTVADVRLSANVVTNQKPNVVLSGTFQSTLLSRLPRFKTKYAQTLLGQTNLNIIAIGDSTFHGAKAGGLDTNAVSGAGMLNLVQSNVWTTLYNRAANGGIGWMGSHNFLSDSNYYTVKGQDSTLSFGTNWIFLDSIPSLGGPAYFGIAPSTNAITWSPPKAFSTLSVYCITFPGNGAFSIFVDGVSNSTHTTAASAGVAIKTVTFTLGVHTVSIVPAATNAVNANVAIIGMVAGTSNSINFIDAGWDGASSVNIGNASTTYGPIAAAMGYPASLYLLEGGTLNESYPWTDTAAHLTGIINYLTNTADVVLVIPSANSSANFGVLSQIYYTVGAAMNVPVIDLNQWTGGYAAASSSGRMFDITHPNALGYMDESAAFLQLFQTGNGSSLTDIALSALPVSVQNIAANGITNNQSGVTLSNVTLIAVSIQGALTNNTTGAASIATNAQYVPIEGVQITMITVTTTNAPILLNNLEGGISKASTVTVSNNADLYFVRAFGNVTGTFTGSGSNLTHLQASQLEGSVITLSVSNLNLINKLSVTNLSSGTNASGTFMVANGTGGVSYTPYVNSTNVFVSGNWIIYTITTPDNEFLLISNSTSAGQIYCDALGGFATMFAAATNSGAAFGNSVASGYLAFATANGIASGDKSVVMSDVSSSKATGIGSIVIGQGLASGSESVIIGDGFFVTNAVPNATLITGKSITLATSNTNRIVITNGVVYGDGSGLSLNVTNATPTGLTWGVTAPDLWLVVTNNGVRGFIPWFINH